MKRLFIFTSFLFTLIAVTQFTAKAAPVLLDVDLNEFNTVAEELSANFTHHSISGASSRAGWILPFGLEVGLIGGVADSPEFDRLDSSSDFTELPHVAILVAAGLPMGIGVEANLFPTLDADGTEFSHFSGALKWTLSDVFFSNPLLHLAVKAHFSSSELTYSQTISGVNSTVTFDNGVSGFMVLGSLKLMVLEPYVGLGVVNGSSDLTISGSQSFLAGTISGQQSVSSDPDSTHLVAGAEFHLPLIKIGVEYASLFDTSSISGKFSFAF